MSVARLASRKNRVAPSRPLIIPNPPPSTRSTGPSSDFRVLPPIERASSLTSRKLGMNSKAKATTAAPAGVPTASVRPVDSWVWNSLSIAMATTQANSDSTSWTKPRTKPMIAPPPSSRMTKMSSALIAVRLAGYPPLRQPRLASEDMVGERFQIGELGQRDSASAFDPGRHPRGLEAELRRFLEPQSGVRDRPDLAGQGDLADHHALARHRTFCESGYQGGRDCQVSGGVRQPVAAGDIQIDLGGRKAEPAPRLEDREDHRQPSGIPADRGAPRSRAARQPHRQRLDLDQHRPGTLQRREDAGP